MMRKALAIICILIFFTSLVFASFPGISFDLWVDFEGLSNGTNPTTTTMANSSHCSPSTNCQASTWALTNATNLTGNTSTGQCPLSGMGDTGAKGMQYTSATGLTGFATWTLPVAKSAVSAGMCFFSEDFHLSTYNFCEMDHFFTFENTGFGQLWRFSSERSSGDNTRQIRLSAGNNRIAISDLTWYWVTGKYVQGGTVQMAVYNITGGAIGSQLAGSPISDTDTDNATVTDVNIGNFQAASCALTETAQIDNVIIDSTNATFPLLPTNLTPNTTTIGPTTKIGPTITQ